MKDNYQIMADAFMVKTGTTMTVNYLGHFRYFDSDKKPRDVYEITLQRGGKTYTFRFGQSLAKSAKNTILAPSAYDVLACLQKHDPGTFRDFCYDFGYNEDSHKTLNIYLAVQNEWTNVNALFQDVLEELREIE